MSGLKRPAFDIEMIQQAVQLLVKAVKGVEQRASHGCYGILRDQLDDSTYLAETGVRTQHGDAIMRTASSIR
jgi:hypothetical protein